ncbi:death-inducer obliterator 1 isoform X1 [Onthophagus taurus]|uniref:death-inducer obliterator 1 isoform X1 n=1 Tax=Onthophagus taurus TaxID=166361 RepID=UPI0039BEBE78
MAHSIVKVTESQGNDSLLLVIGEDGTVTPDKETVQSYLNNRPGATELQVMHMNKTDGRNIDITLDTLTYIHSEEIIESEEDMDNLQRNLLNFRMDHDYTPLTSPKRQTPSPQTETIDELAHTLSLLDGSVEEPVKIKPKQPGKSRKVISLSMNRNQKAKMITTSQNITKPKQIAVINKITKISKPQDEEEAEDDESDEHFNEEEDDDNDSDFELEEKPKIIKRGISTRTRRSTDTPKMKKAFKKEPKPEPESPKNEKEIEIKSESKQPDKKTPKKEKKVPKPPDDFALFSTPDIIRRVGGKEPQTPTTPTTPETPKLTKPAKISMENRSKSNDVKKRLSVDQKRISLDEKTRRTSLDKQNKSTEKKESRVTVQGYDESLGSNSSESMMESQLEPLPSAEDIRSIIQNENTKSFTTSLIIPETDMESNDQNQLESGGLELDQSILDNINTDLISEDILYQVAQSLAENPDLQNVIDKSIVDGNLILDPSLQNLNEEQSLQSNQQTQSNNVQHATSSFGESSNTTPKGTQIIRPDGRVLVLPPIERPTTRSRNRRGVDNTEVRQVTRPVKPLDDQHVSGNELDSSDEEEESEDDPNKLWCICNQPHNNRFMICCDTCEEWYHGKCVNVTKAMGQMMEQEGKEWICVYCKDHSLKRPSAAARRVRKASRASRTSTDSASSQRKSTSALSSESTKSPACIVCRKSSRSNSIYCSDECILKHAQGVEKVVVFDRRTGKTLSGSAAPSAANLEKWLKEHPGFEVARPRPKKMMQSKLQLVKNSGNDGVSLSVNKKGVSIGVLEHSPKQEQGLKSKLITGVKILNKNAPSTPQKTVKLIQPVPITRPQSAVTNTTTPTKPRILNPGVRQQTTPPPPKEKVVVMKTPKARQAEVNQQPKTENVRDNVRKTLMEQLMNRLKMTDDLKLTPNEVTNISNDIESQLYKCFGDTGQKYRTKYRSLIFNIKDVKNQTLWRRICEKAINPYQLVRLSHDDLASQELALWRQREAKHQLDMIEKSELELLNCNRQYVFKTHKGEQVFEDDRPKDQTVTEVITALNNEVEKDDGKKDSSKDKDKKSSKKRERSRDRKSSKEKSDSKERRKDHRSSSRDRDKDKDRSRDKERDRKKRSRSRDRSRHSDKHRSRSRDRDRHRKSSHKSSRHKKEPAAETKLDKKSKEILEQLVDKQIVPPLEDRLWKHVPQEDVVAGNPESDSDHEPSSTVTIPTPPRNSESDEPQSTPVMTVTTDKTEKKKPIKSISVETIESISPKAESVESRTADNIWTGTINMVDVAQISITAHEVSGDCNGLSDELPPSLDIVGRITPETVWDYIGKMKCLHSKMISLLRLNATNIEEKMPYIALYSYLSSRNRLGVVKSINKAVKDFYILPLGSNDPIPPALLPINGAGFEDNRPPLLVGIIVRDKRKRPMLDSITSAVLNKKSKIDSSVSSPTVKARSATPPLPATTTRSYTPPPSRDPRLKPVYNTSTPLPAPSATSTADEDEPYSPEDSDPEATTPPLPSTDSTNKTATQAASTTTTTLINPVIKSNSSFLSSQTFKPFSNKFDDIPGLDLQDTNNLPASTLELQRKMAELDQIIAMQQAEIQNMSQDIVSSASATSSDIGTSALANIALPNNLQQILENIKIIGAQTKTESDSPTSKVVSSPQQDLTIPLMLPKISSRTNQKVETSSPTIPLNLPKLKGNKQSAANSPQPSAEADKSSSSVLSSLSEEDLIRKAAEMLGETETPVKKQKRNEPEKEVPPPPIYTPSPSLFSQPPPLIVAPPQAQNVCPLQNKRSRDMSQPPIPGLEDEC